MPRKSFSGKLTQLWGIYYLYTQSSKKYGELKSLYKDLKDQFEMYGGELKPVKSNDIRCFAMIRVV